MVKKTEVPITKEKKPTLAKKKSKARVLQKKKSSKGVKKPTKEKRVTKPKVLVIHWPPEWHVIESTSIEEPRKALIIKHKPLTDKQQLFIKEYCIDFNATKAAIRTWYSLKTGYSIWQELLKKPEIQLWIAEYMSERVLKLWITADTIVQGLQSIINKCMQLEKITVRKTVWREKEDIDINTWFITKYRRPEDIYEEVLGEFNPAGAIAALERISRIMGIYDSSNNNNNGKPKQEESLNDKQKAAILALSNQYKPPVQE